MEKIKRNIKFLIILIIALMNKYLFNLNRDKKNTLDFKNINKILVIRLDEIGDVVMTTPLLRELRRNYSKAHITLIVKPQVYNLIELCPFVNVILTYDREVGKFSFFRNIIKCLFFSTQYLVKGKYDLCLVPRWDIDDYFASLISFFSGARIRIGYSEHVNSLKKSLNKNYDKFFTETINDATLKHEVIRNLEFIKFLEGNILDTKLEVWINHEDIIFSMNLISNFIKKEDCILIAIFPEAGNNRREWGASKYISLINLIQQYFNVKFILFGSRKIDDYDEISNFKNKKNLLNCIGETTIRQTIAILKNCSFYLGGDTGPMHLAAAIGLEGVVISCHPQNGDPHHANSIHRFGPWQSKMKIIQPKIGLNDCKDGCNKDYAHCINQISVEEVFEMVKVILTNNFSSPIGGFKKNKLS